MTRRLLTLAALWVAVGLSVVAADFWEEKPFRSWSDQEVNQMLTNSPWADEVAVALPPQLRPSGAAGGGGFDTGGGGGGGTAPTREREQESFANVSRVRMSVSWRSALPVKQALLREQIIGEGAEPSAENLAYLEPDTRFYIIGVLGVPTQFGRVPTDQVRAESFLEREDKPPITADGVLFQPRQDGLLLLVAFPKTDPVTLEDQDVEFVTNLGGFSIKKRFRLRDMVLQGGLAL